MNATERALAIERFFVVTGGPGSGKSTLIDALTVHGIGGSTEAGRAIIRDQVAIGGTALPWADRNAFADQMLEYELRSYRLAEATRRQFVFDRGLPDIIGYRHLCGLPALEHFDRAARLYRYNCRVFVAPPWPDIFVQDDERKQTLVEAEATFHAVSAAYVAFGYELLALPLAPVSGRVSFVLDHIAECEPVPCI